MTVLLCLEGELEVAVLQGLTAAEIQVARRCADTVELLATAAAGLGRVAVVARLDVASAGALRRYGVRILGVGVAPGPAYDAVATPVPTEIVAEVRALGAQNEPGGSGSPVDGELGRVGSRGGEAGSHSGEGSVPGGSAIDTSGGSPTVAPVVVTAGASGDGPGRHGRRARRVNDDAGGTVGATADPTPGGTTARTGTNGGHRLGAAGEPAEFSEIAPGRMICVWGSAGAPGRSVIARDLAAEWQGRALLVDADTRHPCQAQLLGVGQESSALIALARRINTGRTDTQAGNLLEETHGFRLLAGMNTGSRWREIPGAVADAMWPLLRCEASIVVVDCAAEAEHEDSVLERDALTLSAVGAADKVVVVGRGGPVGVRRLLTQLEIAGALGVVVGKIVITRAPTQDRPAVQRILEQRGFTDVTFVRADKAYVEAEYRGTTLREVAPRSGARADMRRLAAEL